MVTAIAMFAFIGFCLSFVVVMWFLVKPRDARHPRRAGGQPGPEEALGAALLDPSLGDGSPGADAHGGAHRHHGGAHHGPRAGAHGNGDAPPHHDPGHTHDAGGHGFGGHDAGGHDFGGFDHH